MSTPPPSPARDAPSHIGLSLDRARLLRDATADLVAKGRAAGLAAARYEALARGFLPQITREAAIEIARMLAGCPILTPGIADAFAEIGIKIKGATIAPTTAARDIHVTACATEQELPVADHRFFAGPLMDSKAAEVAATWAQPEKSAGHHNTLDPVRGQVLARAAERADIDDFSAITVEVLRELQIVATAAGVTRMLRDKTGEPSALLIHAIGGDKALLIKAVQAFVRDCPSITGAARNALTHFAALTPDRARAVVAMFFGAVQEKPRAAAQHFTVQSGQSLQLRATGQAHGTAHKQPLSQRIAATLKR